MSRKLAFFALLAAGCLAATVTLLPGVVRAQDSAAKVKTSMAALKAETAKLGAPKLEGNDKVGDKDVPALHFGAARSTTTTRSSTRW